MSEEEEEEEKEELRVLTSFFFFVGLSRLRRCCRSWLEIIKDFLSTLRRAERIRKRLILLLAQTGQDNLPEFFLKKKRCRARADAILQQKKRLFWECDARGRRGEIEMSALAESPPEPIKRRKGFLSYFFMSLTGEEDIYC